jgi:hypothetical protein
MLTCTGGMFIHRWFTVYVLIKALVVGLVLGLVKEATMNSTAISAIYGFDFVLVLITRPMVSM